MQMWFLCLGLFFFYLRAEFIFSPLLWKSLWNVGCNVMINRLVSLGQTNDSLANKHKKKLADGFTSCVVVRKVALTFRLTPGVHKDYTFTS